MSDTRQPISTPDAPGAIGPYSQAISAGDFLFLSGQIPLDPATGELVGGSIADQTHRVLQNLGLLLWLGYRMRSVSRRYVISWPTLMEQFGANVARSRKFKEMFADDLAAMKEVFPALPVELGPDGITLRPCDPEQVFSTGSKRLT